MKRKNLDITTIISQALKVTLLPVFLMLTCFCAAQGFLDKAKEKARKLKEAAIQTKAAAQAVTGAAVEITSSVKTLKQTWKKDTSSNISYAAQLTARGEFNEIHTLGKVEIIDVVEERIKIAPIPSYN